MAESARRRNVTPALTAPDAQQPAGTRGCHRVSLPALWRMSSRGLGKCGAERKAGAQLPGGAAGEAVAPA